MFCRTKKNVRKLKILLKNSHSKDFNGFPKSACHAKTFVPLTCTLVNKVSNYHQLVFKIQLIF